MEADGVYANVSNYSSRYCARYENNTRVHGGFARAVRDRVDGASDLAPECNATWNVTGRFGVDTDAVSLYFAGDVIVENATDSMIAAKIAGAMQTWLSDIEAYRADVLEAAAETSSRRLQADRVRPTDRELVEGSKPLDVSVNMVPDPPGASPTIAPTPARICGIDADCEYGERCAVPCEECAAPSFSRRRRRSLRFGNYYVYAMGECVPATSRT